jgi:hypothetical protein
VDPLFDFVATPSIRVLIGLVVAFAAADLAYTFECRGFDRGSMSAAFGRLYRDYPGLDYPLLAAWIALGLFLRWHFRSCLPR